tara:strand:+ start:887 stop:1120 length:234 start_codon:yes stop_codon:yes gene_type:complete
VPKKEGKSKYDVGTLIEDMGKIGVISKVIQSGALKTEFAAIKWRLNYEICYIDGDVQVVGESTFIKLIDKGVIKVIS